MAEIRYYWPARDQAQVVGKPHARVDGLAKAIGAAKYTYDINLENQLFAKAFSDYAAVMAKANYDFTKIATDPALQQGLQAMADPKVQQAGQNLQAWAQKNCPGR